MISRYAFTKQSGYITSRGLSVVAGTSHRVSGVPNSALPQVPRHQHRAVATTSPKNKVSHPSHASHLSHGDVVGSILCIISIQRRRASWNHRQMANRESGIGNRDWSRTPSAFG